MGQKSETKTGTTPKVEKPIPQKGSVVNLPQKGRSSEQTTTGTGPKTRK